jgi:hypothetical protein
MANISVDVHVYADSRIEAREADHCVWLYLDGCVLHLRTHEDIARMRAALDELDALLASVPQPVDA